VTPEAVGFYHDYSNNRITAETLKLLLQLADESALRQRIDSMLRGEKINTMENRAVLQVALASARQAV
jgi:glucose-6-phosphate isomerase